MKTILWGLFCALGAHSMAQIIRPATTGLYQFPVHDQQFREVFSSKLNPAALAWQAHFELGAFAEKQFLLQNLRQYTIAVGLPVSNGGCGFSVDYAGLPGFSQWQSSLGYGIRLGQLTLGAQIQHLARSASGYGNNGHWTLSLGTLWKPSPIVTTGFSVQHLSGNLFSRKVSMRPAYSYAAGIGLKASEAVLLEAMLSKEELQKPALRSALHFRADKRLMASLFYDLTEALPSIRVKWLAGLLQLGVTGSYHALLGFSPGILLIGSPAGKEEK